MDTGSGVIRRLGAIAGAALVLALVWAGPASAHGDYVSSDPAKGERLNKKPQHIAIELSEAPVENSKIAVFDGCGDDVTQATYVDGRTIHAVPAKSAGKGRWRVEYQIVSAEDGHRTEGSFGFRVKGRCVEESETEEPEGNGDGSQGDADGEDPSVADDEPSVVRDEGGDLPLVLFAVAGIAIIGIAVLARRGGGA